MNDIAIIFQRSSIGTAKEREAEAAQLERYAASRNLKIVSMYVATGEPNILIIDMLINHCIAREKPGHVVVTALSRLWTGENPATIIGMVERAGAIVHVVPEEFA